MLAEKLFGNVKKYNVILLIEGVKCLLKLLIFISTKGKPVLHSLLNEQSPPLLKNCINSKFEMGKLSGKLTSVPADIQFNYKSLVSPKESSGSLREIVGIVQPVVYGNVLFYLIGSSFDNELRAIWKWFKVMDSLVDKSFHGNRFCQ